MGRAEALRSGGDATTLRQTAAVAGNAALTHRAPPERFMRREETTRKASLKLLAPPKRVTRCERCGERCFQCGGFERRHARNHPKTNHLTWRDAVESVCSQRELSY